MPDGPSSRYCGCRLAAAAALASDSNRATRRGQARMLPTAPIRGAAMIHDVLGASWFIALMIVTYGLATGQLCVWRRDN